MECRQVCQADIELLAKYNERMFPQRGAFATKYIKFLFSKAEYEYLNSVVIDNNGEIQGQSIASSMQFFYNGEMFDGVWGMDLIINEELRKEAYGLDLMALYSKKHKNRFSTGAGPVAVKIHLALGNKWLGEIRKYIGVVNLLGLTTSFLRGVVSPNKFPQSVKVKDSIFTRRSVEEVEWAEHPYNEELWEPCRDNEYMRWRFSNKLHEYAIYKDANSDNYFVLRTIVKKGITAVVLVDFRCNLQQKHELSVILQAIKKIMRKMWLAILICGSSHANIDKQLERAYMKSIGRPRPIIGKIHYKDRKSDIDNRQFALVTLADSDGETLW